jgi:hypothetical protein
MTTLHNSDFAKQDVANINHLTGFKKHIPGPKQNKNKIKLRWAAAVLYW